MRYFIVINRDDMDESFIVHAPTLDMAERAISDKFEVEDIDDVYALFPETHLVEYAQVLEVQ